MKKISLIVRLARGSETSAEDASHQELKMNKFMARKVMFVALGAFLAARGNADDKRAMA